MCLNEVWTMGELLVEIMRPRAGMTLCELGDFHGPFPSGAPGIFIDTVARLGHSASIISGVGEDDFGRCLLNRFQRDGVRTDFIEVFANKSTGVAFVTCFEDGSRNYIFHWDGTPAVMARTPSAQKIGGTGPRFFHIVGCSLMANEQFRQRVFETVELFAREGARITFDPNIRFELLGGRNVEEVETSVAELFQQHPLMIIVLKRGSRGCVVHTPEGKEEIPAVEVAEVDPTGAGDCFDAGFLCGQLEGGSTA
jgi:sugar/nucleoside kinase (ribokinase family)